MKKYIENTNSKNEFNQIKVEVYYSLGGINYFDGESSKRGIYCGFRAVKREDHNGYKSESFNLFGEEKDGKILLKELKRNSEKTLEKIGTKFFKTFSDERLLEIYNSGDRTDFYYFIQNLGTL